jgi:hypothetical protein
MRTSFKSVVAGVVTLFVAGAIATVGATSASAAGPFDPTLDTQNYGTVTFFNAAGQVVTSGNALDPLSAQYAVASTTPANVVVPRTVIQIFQPQPGVNPGLFSGITLNTTTLYPLTAAGVPAIVSSSPNPQGSMTAASTPFSTALGAFALNPAPLTNVYQVRLTNVLLNTYAAATIHIDPVTNIWTQIDPAPAAAVTPTTTSLAVSPASPATAPANVTLAATVAPTAAGSVQFFNGATSLGTSPVAAGVATMTLPGVAAGSFSYTATFTPTDPLAFGPSTSTAVPFVVNSPLPTPTIGLTASSAAPFVGSPVTFTATITNPVAPGTIQFFDGAISLAPASATTTLTTSTLALGLHSVTARFVPTDPAAFNAATSLAVSINVQAVLVGACAATPANCTSAAPFTVDVAAGSLVISTPYTVASPFRLGTMVLNAAATELSTGKVPFGSATGPTGQAGLGVYITDQRAGDLPWTANLSSSPFTGPGTINARNLGFTEVLPQYVPGNALNALTKPVLTFDNAATTPAVAPTDTTTLTGLASSKIFASAAHGFGTVNVNGNFTLNAPTSTPAGTYVATVTFTIA